jgi:hypothetical protein
MSNLRRFRQNAPSKYVSTSVQGVRLSSVLSKSLPDHPDSALRQEPAGTDRGADRDDFGEDDIIRIEDDYQRA